MADGAVLAVDGREHQITAETAEGRTTADGFWLGPTSKTWIPTEAPSRALLSPHLGRRMRRQG